MRHIERQNYFWTKTANNRVFFLIQNLRILDRCAFMHCKIATATSYKEKSFRK